MHEKQDTNYTKYAASASQTDLATTNRIAFCLLLTAFFILAGKGLGQGSANGPVSTATPPARLERIHFGDIVDVDFVGSFDFDWRGGLTREGFLDGLERAEKPVLALCRTEAAVAESVAEQHRYFLKEPKVVVKIVDRSNRALAYVSGAVRVPQRFQLRRAVSLLELIVLSGGITESSKGEIVIFRPPNLSCGGGENGVDGKPKTISIKIADLLSGSADANQQIVTGDIVNVIEAPPVFVIGDVAAPRRMNLTPDLTLSRAIASAGGISRSFFGQKARVHRRGPEPKVLEFDLRRIVEKKDQDLKLEPYDVIEVEQKGFSSRRIAPVHEPRPPDSQTLSKLPLRIVD
jgi:protein involved in polysaccharide export with SLBB domain